MCARLLIAGFSAADSIYIELFSFDSHPQGISKPQSSDDDVTWIKNVKYGQVMFSKYICLVHSDNWKYEEYKIVENILSQERE